MFRLCDQLEVVFLPNCVLTAFQGWLSITALNVDPSKCVSLLFCWCEWCAFCIQELERESGKTEALKSGVDESNNALASLQENAKKANEEANRLRAEQQEAESKFEVCFYGSSFYIPFSVPSAVDANP